MAQLDMNNLKTALAQNNTKMKEWITAQLGTGGGKELGFQWVDVLPKENISTATIYMLKDEKSTEVNNIYIEYVYKEDSGWEIIGSLNAGSIELENYYDKEETEALIQTFMEAYTDDEVIAMVNGIWSE